MKNPPVNVNGIEQSEDKICLTYQNEAGSVIVKRTHMNTSEMVIVVDTEIAYNFTTDEWEVIHAHDRTHELYQDGTTLRGDGSNWDGQGIHWRKWAIHQHYKRLGLRFPNDTIDTERYTLSNYAQYESRVPETAHPNRSSV